MSNAQLLQWRTPPPRLRQCGSHLVLVRCFRACGAKSRLRGCFVSPECHRGKWCRAFDSLTCLVTPVSTNKWLGRWGRHSSQSASQRRSQVRSWQGVAFDSQSCRYAAVPSVCPFLPLRPSWCSVATVASYTYFTPFDAVCTMPGDTIRYSMSGKALIFDIVFLYVYHQLTYTKKKKSFISLFSSLMILTSGTTCVATLGCWNKRRAVVNIISMFSTFSVSVWGSQIQIILNVYTFPKTCVP